MYEFSGKRLKNELHVDIKPCNIAVIVEYVMANNIFCYFCLDCSKQLLI